MWTAENGAFRKTLTSNGHVISATVLFRSLIQNGGFMLMLICLLSSLIACLELNVALYNLYAIAQIVCFPQKITTQEGGNRERR